MANASQERILHRFKPWQIILGVGWLLRDIVSTKAFQKVRLKLLESGEEGKLSRLIVSFSNRTDRIDPWLRIAPWPIFAGSCISIALTIS
jgi:hypothetical protein